MNETSTMYLLSILITLSFILLLMLTLIIIKRKSFVTNKTTSLCWCCQKYSNNNQNNQNNILITSNKERISKELVKSFSCDNQHNDYEEDVHMIFNQQKPCNDLNQQQQHDDIDDDYYIHKLNECLNETNQWYNNNNLNNSKFIQANHFINDYDDQEEEENERLIPPRSLSSTTTTSSKYQTKSNKSKFQRQQSICLNNNDELLQITNNNNDTTTIKNRSRNLLKQQAIYTSIALKNTTTTKAFELYNDDHQYQQNKKIHNNSNDLISLAEKGRIGKQTSTSSISSETGSNITNIDDATANIIQITSNNNNKRRSNNNILKRLQKAGGSSDTTATTTTTTTNDDLKDINHNGHGNNKYQTLNNYYDNNNNNNNYESDTQSSNLPDFSPNATLSSEQNMMLTTTTTKSGRLEISFAYDAPSKKLFVTVIQGDDIPNKDQQHHTNTICQIYVKLILLTPFKKQKFRTKSKPIFCPVFDETFTFNRINPDEISTLGLCFRVFTVGFTRKTYLIGESRMSFACIKPQQQETKLWFTLEIPAKRNRLLDLESSSLARTDSTSSQSLQNTSSPELLLSLAYNGTTGRLSVTLIKGSQFRSLSTRTPDTYIKLLLVSQSGSEMARSKTHVCRGQPNPLVRETFVFQVALFQLPDVTLMIFVYNKRSIKRKELIGWISLGYNSSGDEELSHWNDMRDNKGEQVSRWHVLHEQ